MVTCSKCGRDISPVEDQHYCQFCGERLPIEGKDEPGQKTEVAPEQCETVAPETAPLTDNKAPTPWEDTENYGFFDGMTRTISQSLFQPRSFFAGITWEGGMLQPVLYALILNTIGAVAGYSWSALIGSSSLGSLGLTGKPGVLIGLTLPFTILVGLFIEASLIHLALMVIGAANRGFEATVRVICYSSAPELLNVIPIIGGLISPFWKLYLILIGLREGHTITMAKAVLTMALLAVVCCGLPFVGIVALLLAVS
jgi:hypothetical protein